jgi:hypothetical protein
MSLRDCPLWVGSGLLHAPPALHALANFIVANDRCKTVRGAFVANIICKNSMSELVDLTGELVANFIVRPQADVAN